MFSFKCFLLPAALLMFGASVFSQKAFTNCAAAFLDQKMVVDEYTDQGKCEITTAATGILTVQTASLSPELSTPTGKTEFRIAIRDGNTNTLWSFSSRSYEQIDIQTVLRKCRPGDHIVLLTVKDEYALPHHEILVSGPGN